jgi:hypothetical protein
MVGKTSYPVEQALVEPLYYLTEWWLTHPTTTMKQDRCLLTTFQPFLLSKFCWKLCDQTESHSDSVNTTSFRISFYCLIVFNSCQLSTCL